MSDFKGHYIRSNKSCTFPRRLICFDTETDQNILDNGDIEQTFKLGTAVYRYTIGGRTKPTETWFETDISDKLCKFIVSKCHIKEKLYIISANIWFDFRVSLMVQYLKERKWKNKILVINGMTIILSFVKDKKHIVFINFQNYFRVSVATMGKIVGLPKLDVEFETVSMRELFRYCRRDTEIIYRAMIMLFSFIKDHNLGAFGYTQPTIAFNAYRHRFMHFKLLVHKNPAVVKIERAGYFGARTECFRVGAFTNTPLVQVDINSMYPHQMLSQKYPTKLTHWGMKCRITTLDHFCRQGCVMARVIINTDEPVYPVKLDGKTIFPIGSFEANLSTPELIYGIKHNHIREVKEYAYYWSANIFSEYIEYFYNLRLKYKATNNIAYDSFCKYMMNALYGKFGQKSDLVLEDSLVEGAPDGRTIEFHADKKCFITTTNFFGRMIKTMPRQQEGRNAIVSIAAHVTAYGRMKLWEYIKKVGRDNLFYCDTDCLIMHDKPELLKLIPISDTILGDFKIEKRATKIVIHTLKDYHFARSQRIKGVSKRAEHIGKNKYKQFRFPGILSELKSGLNKPYIVHSQEKDLKRVYTKGTTLKGGRVVPYKLNYKAVPV